MRTSAFLAAASNARAHHWKASAFEPRRCSRDPARLGVELETLIAADGVAGRRGAEQNLVGRQQPGPLLRRPIQRHQRQRRLAVAGIRRQDPLVRLERPLGLIELLLRQHRHPLEEARARRHVGRAIGQGGQLVAQLAVRPLLGVERFEGAVVARLGVDLAQSAGGAPVLCVERLDSLEDLDGRLGGAHPLVEQRAAPLEQRQLRGRVSPHVLSLALEDLHQRRPAPLALVERGQPRQRRLVARLDGQHLVIERDRLARVVEPLARQARHLAEPRPLAGGVDVRQLLAQQLDEGAPGAGLGIKVLEPGGRLGVGRIRLEDLLEAGHRVLVLAQLVRPQRRDPPVQRHAGRRVGRGLRLARQDLDQIAVAPLRLVAAGQRRQRGRVVRLERQDVEVGRHHHDVEAQAIAVDRHDLQVAVDLLLDVAGRDRVEVVLQELEERVPLLGLRVELAQRGDRLGEVGLEAQDPLPDLDRLVGVLRPRLGGARHLDPHRHPAIDVGLRLLRLGEDHQELRHLVPRRVVGAVELDHLPVGGIQLPDAAEERLRHVRLLEPIANDLGQIDQQRHVLLAALGPGRRLQHLGQVGPGLARGQLGADGAQRARLVGIRLQRLVEMNERLVGAPELLAELAGRDLGGRALLSRLRPLGALEVERQELVAPPRLAQHPFQVRP